MSPTKLKKHTIFSLLTKRCRCSDLFLVSFSCLGSWFALFFRILFVDFWMISLQMLHEITGSERLRCGAIPCNTHLAFATHGKLAILSDRKEFPYNRHFSLASRHFHRTIENNSKLQCIRACVNHVCIYCIGSYSTI